MWRLSASTVIVVPRAEMWAAVPPWEQERAVQHRVRSTAGLVRSKDWIEGHAPLAFQLLKNLRTFSK